MKYRRKPQVVEAEIIHTGAYYGVYCEAGYYEIPVATFERDYEPVPVPQEAGPALDATEPQSCAPACAGPCDNEDPEHRCSPCLDGLCAVDHPDNEGRD